MRWKKLMMEKMEEIKAKSEELHSLDLDDDEAYNRVWYELNDLYKWFLIRMEQWLNGIKCSESYKIVYDENREAQLIGKQTGYYMNRVSKDLFKAMEEIL